MTVRVAHKENGNRMTQVVKQGATWFVETYEGNKEVYHFATRSKREAEEAYAIAE